MNRYASLLSLALCAVGLSYGSGVVAAIPVATGSGVGALPTRKDRSSTSLLSVRYPRTGRPQPDGDHNAINAASAAGGGTVVIPAGDFKTFSIRLKSNVGLNLATKDSIIRAAMQGTGPTRTVDFMTRQKQTFVGLQDQGHSHGRTA